MNNSIYFFGIKANSFRVLHSNTVICELLKIRMRIKPQRENRIHIVLDQERGEEAVYCPRFLRCRSHGKKQKVQLRQKTSKKRPKFKCVKKNILRILSYHRNICKNQYKMLPILSNSILIRRFLTCFMLAIPLDAIIDFIGWVLTFFTFTTPSSKAYCKGFLIPFTP